MNIGALQGKIKSVQHLNHTVVRSTVGEEDITITEVNPSKTIILHNWHQSGSGTKGSTRLKNSTTVEILVADGNMAGEIIGIQVVEHY
jgi:hypothetical protein